MDWRSPSNSTEQLYWLFTKKVISLTTSPTSLSRLIFYPGPIVIYATVFLLSVVSLYKKIFISLSNVTKPYYKNISLKKRLALWPLFMDGFNCLKARATSRRQFTFYHSVPRNSWYSFYRPRKDERLSRPWSHPVVLNTRPLGWKTSALTTRPLITAGLFKLKIIPNYCSRSVSIRFLEPIDSYPIRLTSLSESERFQPLSVTKIMPEKIGSNGNKTSPIWTFKISDINNPI